MKISIRNFLFFLSAAAIPSAMHAEPGKLAPHPFQLLASRHPRSVTAIAAIATPLMEPPPSLVRPVAVLYIHGDDDERFSGFEVNSPDFATTPHGNWVTWGYLDGCRIQRAKKTPWACNSAGMLRTRYHTLGVSHANHNRAA